MFIGQRFYRLVVVNLIKDAKNPKAECLCDCGKIIFPQRGALRIGKAKSCGCLRKEFLQNAAKTHGLSKTRTYKIWSGMKSRCSNNRLPEYKNYGGRGIRVEWESFESFVSDMGLAPKGHWIDRINNNDNYKKTNCKWVFPKENQENKRVSKNWVINGNVYSSSVVAAKALNVSPSVIVRGCNGFFRKDRFYKQRDGWYCRLKY